MDIRKLIQGMTVSQNEKNKLALESLDFSRERILDRALVKTIVLTGILEQSEKFRTHRHWGINE
jgi:hypothetical protein